MMRREKGDCKFYQFCAGRTEIGCGSLGGQAAELDSVLATKGILTG